MLALFCRILYNEFTFFERRVNMTLVLKSATSQKRVEVACTNHALDFLHRQGLKPNEENDKHIVFFVESPSAVYGQLLKIGAV